MVDPQQAIDKARKVVTERAELPGMSLMEHLEELRRRLLWSIGYLVLGCCVAWIFHVRIVDMIHNPSRRRRP